VSVHVTHGILILDRMREGVRNMNLLRGGAERGLVSAEEMHGLLIVHRMRGGGLRNMSVAFSSFIK
jgi:hypothetical protein